MLKQTAHNGFGDLHYKKENEVSQGQENIERLKNSLPLNEDTKQTIAKGISNIKINGLVENNEDLQAELKKYIQAQDKLKQDLFKEMSLRKK